MTNPAILEALSYAIEAAIDSVHDMDVTHAQYARVSAASVLELVGPKPLVWEGLSMHMTAETTAGRYTIERGYRPDKTLWCRWIFQTHDDGQSVYFNGYDANDITAAQAAAQAHAYAAHWNNTKLVDML